jgi:hypothetical protein
MPNSMALENILQGGVILGLGLYKLVVMYLAKFFIKLSIDGVMILEMDLYKIVVVYIANTCIKFFLDKRHQLVKNL